MVGVLSVLGTVEEEGLSTEFLVSTFCLTLFLSRKKIFRNYLNICYAGPHLFLFLCFS